MGRHPRQGARPRGLARRLKRFKIRPRTIRLDDDTTAKGYPLEVFEDAFPRYLSDFNRHSDTTRTDTAIEADSQTSQVTDANTAQSPYPSRCDGVTDTNAQNGKGLGFWLACDGVWHSLETDPPQSAGDVKDVAAEILDCEAHPGGHKIARRVAGLVYLACGCCYLEGART